MSTLGTVGWAAASYWVVVAGVGRPRRRAWGIVRLTLTRREALVDPRTGTVIVLASGPSQPTSSNVLRTDWLLSYRPTPGTVFFVGYGGSMSEEDPLAFQRLRRTSDAFFVKGSYVFRLSGM